MNTEEWKYIVAQALQNVVNHEEDLNNLDRALGDGDHGTTIARGMKSAIDALSQETYHYANEVFTAVGNQMLNTMGGASGVLFGVLFRTAKKCSKQADMNVTYLLEMLEAGLEALRKRSGANQGDKTMIDALVPAVEAVVNDVKNGETDIVVALQHAANAAKEGAEATTDMLAHFGRAKFLGERSKFVMDPGSASVSFLFEGLYTAASTVASGEL
ncbi:dihydroxyacetone kinase subunit DhaL [Alicyclobacillus sp. SO9]|uniref:dihydroxyacetone kinase subunit DhaL n=1 Tax=Alicyclobacillus sp. SO9 TaxID=2665646 RepID=UPI0018E90038|nr:dihydroxyacetone kinase subunit DhaL [Alicyclobacillus sp. SO9]QQE77982.1 dihydroxyacetone kinase subunit L [Alicyclobacillus sp. SO9]